MSARTHRPCVWDDFVNLCVLDYASPPHRQSRKEEEDRARARTAASDTAGSGGTRPLPTTAVIFLTDYSQNIEFESCRLARFYCGLFAPSRLDSGPATTLANRQQPAATQLESVPAFHPIPCSAGRPQHRQCWTPTPSPRYASPPPLAASLA